MAAIGPARRRLRRDVRELREIETLSGGCSLAMAVILAIAVAVAMATKLNWMPWPWFAQITVILMVYWTWVRRICSSIIQHFQLVDRLYDTAEQSKIPIIDDASNRIHDQMKIFTTSKLLNIYLVLTIVIQLLCSVQQFIMLDIGRSTTYLPIVLAVVALAQVLIVEYRLVVVNRHMSSINRCIRCEFLNKLQYITF